MWRSGIGLKARPRRPSFARTISAELIQAELARSPLFSQSFLRNIEERFEADLKVDRVFHVRLTAIVGLLAYLSFSLVDQTILPDLGSVPAIFRFFVIAPGVLYGIYMARRFSARLREGFIMAAVMVAMLGPVLFMIVSRARLSPYEMFAVLLVSTYGNLIIRLRFDCACIFTAASILCIGLMVFVRPDLPVGLLATISLASMTSAAFGLIANYQLERAQRRGFLLTLKEVLRSEQLASDREKFSELSLLDPLTGLPNRRSIELKLDELWVQRQSAGRQFALLMIDIDHFKSFNDRYGHIAGDACLAQTAEALRKAVVRKNDMVARFGGEEFVVLLDGTSMAEAALVGDRLCRAVREAAIPHGNRPDPIDLITVSVGVAASEMLEEVSVKQELLVIADRRLYAAKRAGRNLVFSKECCADNLMTTV